MVKEYQFSINRAERQTHLFQKFEDHLNYCIQRDRKKNDDITLGIEETQKLRGGIAFAKKVLSEMREDVAVDDEQSPQD